MVFTYELEAKSRVAGFGTADILAFLELVPERFRDRVFGGLRPIPGFRPDEPRELKERIKKLAKSLSQTVNVSKKGNERDWNALGWVWAGWLQATYKSCVDAALKKHEDEKLGFAAFLKVMLSHEEGNKIAQEDVDEIYKFSPFSSMDAVSELVRSMPTRAELAKKHEVQELKSQLAALEKKVESLNEALASQKKNDTSSLSEQLVKLQSELARISEEFQKLEKRLLLNEEQGISRNNLLGKALESLTHSNDGISKQLSSYEARVSALDKSNAEFIGAVKRIEGIVKVLQKSVVEHDKDRAARKELETAAIASAPGTVIQVEHCRKPEGALIAALDTLQKLHSALTTNYQAIGLGEKASKKLAFTVAASISSGQLTQFVGALADVVADATLSAVAGKATVAWDVPAGLCDGSPVALVLSEVAKSSQSTAGLLLRGFNKSAFDIYGYELKKILVNRLLGLGSEVTEMILVATALKSDACLPFSTSTVELGPVIDTSLLTWVRSKGKITFGQLQAIKYASDTDEQSDTMLTRLANQISDMRIPKSELWRRAARYAKTKLTYFVDADKDVDVEVAESLLMNWVFPWISLQCTSSAEVSAFIRENLHLVDEEGTLGNTVEKYLAAAA
jgi:hypothetical protein